MALTRRRGLFSELPNAQSPQLMCSGPPQLLCLGVFPLCGDARGVILVKHQMWALVLVFCVSWFVAVNWEFSTCTTLPSVLLPTASALGSPTASVLGRIPPLR